MLFDWFNIEKETSIISKTQVTDISGKNKTGILRGDELKYCSDGSIYFGLYDSLTVSIYYVHQLINSGHLHILR